MAVSKDINQYMDNLGSRAKAASLVLASLSTKKKNEAIESMASALNSEKNSILEANSLDLVQARKKKIEEVLLDRLELTLARVDLMISGLKSVAKLPDPIGQITNLEPTPSGIKVSKMRVPLGVVGIIYESRPNVTAEAAALCLKAGNACILRGGSEAFYSNTRIAECMKKGLKALDIVADSSNAHIPYFLAIEVYKPRKEWIKMAEMLDEAVRRNPTQKLEKPIVLDKDDISKENILTTIEQAVLVYRKELWISLYNGALESYNNGEITSAMEQFNSALRVDPSKIQTYIVLSKFSKENQPLSQYFSFAYPGVSPNAVK